jgi:hypothetical protein
LGRAFFIGEDADDVFGVVDVDDVVLAGDVVVVVIFEGEDVIPELIDIVGGGGVGVVIGVVVVVALVVEVVVVALVVVVDVVVGLEFAFFFLVAFTRT